jgi:transcriptional regulator GlxA family with amidase domain
VFPTGRSFAFDLQDVRQSLVQFDRTFLEGVAAEEHGVQPGPLVFDHATPPRREDLRAWNAQVQRAAAVVLGSAPVTQLALDETARETAKALLRTFPHTVLAPEVTLPQGATGRVREAVEYMHAYAHTPISTTDVAAHVGLSVRGLQQAFQRQVGTAPNAMLRGIRLDRVRDELRQGAPGHVTVAAVAVKWGFAHLGRFSGAYLTRFGEYPRDTLHA